MTEAAVEAPSHSISGSSSSVRSSRSFKQRVTRSLRGGGGASKTSTALRERAEALARELQQVDTARANLEEENARLVARLERAEELNSRQYELCDKLARKAADVAALEENRAKSNFDALRRTLTRFQAALALVVLAWAAAVHLGPDHGPVIGALAIVVCSTLLYFQHAAARIDPPRTRPQIAKAVAQWRAAREDLVAQNAKLSDPEDRDAADEQTTSVRPQLANGVVVDRTRDSKYIEAKERFIKGLVDALDPEEFAALEEMRSIFANASCIELDEDIGTFRLNDQTFLRFLRARDYNVSKASAMLQNHLEWRDRVVPAKVRAHEIAKPLQSGMTRRSGNTFDGEPITMVQIGKFDPADFDSVTQFVKYVAYFFEINLSVIDPEVERGVIFIDMQGYSPRKHMSTKARKIIFAFIHVVQDQNPETLKKLVLFNVPAIFRMAWNVIKGAIDPVVRDKILFATDLSVVRQDVPPHLLNVRYGGEKEDEWPIDGLDQLDDANCVDDNDDDTDDDSDTM
ncbi:Phosphatidylinositol/phosphatidylcholine transfer protein SFH8 [Hondaea fermentalgiana]|uniref:Phosphatidylinositol/phosphatidylcholine transfer protein SFH8 n=1 Tax=Hondaea fermentalgiana TaxID=2315210 RepID=A0A2R5GJW0_9STRA|nr:Phosphatidylinositol/phosphatidylcholine transfer protein SFH8 [Hondaea fermentalgiana]|eukprot:GBG30609.1 Phosphatidylinositol/phosphatidylcholine transfer protein SFH8 [Hondaea fermentalgiana]